MELRVNLYVQSLQPVKEKISFIKMNIEGAEVDTISGGKNHIENDTPKMAICVYHKKMICGIYRRKYLEYIVSIRYI